MTDPTPPERCGFCDKGIYQYANGRRAKCPYCNGTGEQILPVWEAPSD